MDCNETHGQHDGVSNFIQLVFENDRRIYAYIYVLVPNQAEADDLFQDTITVMWEKFDTFRTRSDFGAWGVGIAYNLIRNYRRAKARSRLRFEEDIEQLLESETRGVVSRIDFRVEALKKCMFRLNQDSRDILKYKYEINYTTKIIAEKIGCSLKAVYVKLARANDYLLRCIRRTLAEQNIRG